MEGSGPRSVELSLEHSCGAAPGTGLCRAPARAGAVIAAALLLVAPDVERTHWRYAVPPKSPAKASSPVPKAGMPTRALPVRSQELS